MKILLAPNFKPSLFGETFPPELLAIFLEAKEQLDCLHVSLWATNAEENSSWRTSGNVVATTYPLLWVNKYAIRGFANIDPAITKCLGGNSILFVDYTDRTNDARHEFYAAVRKAKIGAYSISVPINLNNGFNSVATYSFAGTQNPDLMQQHEFKTICREFAHRIASNAIDLDYGESIKLTKREILIIDAIANGYTNQEIGDALNISRWTIIAHTKSIREKLNAKSNAEAVQIALRQKVI